MNPAPTSSALKFYLRSDDICFDTARYDPYAKMDTIEDTMNYQANDICKYDTGN